MGYAVDESILQHMRERAMTDVVHQYSSLNRLGLTFKDKHAFLREREYGLTRKMKSAQ